MVGKTATYARKTAGMQERTQLSTIGECVFAVEDVGLILANVIDNNSIIITALCYTCYQIEHLVFTL